MRACDSYNLCDVYFLRNKMLCDKLGDQGKIRTSVKMAQTINHTSKMNGILLYDFIC